MKLKNIFDAARKEGLSPTDLAYLVNYVEDSGDTGRSLYLQRRGWLDESNKLTSKTISFLASLETGEVKVRGETSNIKELFERFWLAYPANDGWAHFATTRGLRYDKTRTFVYFKELLDSKTVTTDQLLNALAADLLARRKASISENQLKFMPNCAKWLRQKMYEPFLEEPVISVPVTPLLPKLE